MKVLQRRRTDAKESSDNYQYFVINFQITHLWHVSDMKATGLVVIPLALFL